MDDMTVERVLHMFAAALCTLAENPLAVGLIVREKRLSARLGVEMPLS
jgi:hypothetical protein